MREVWAAAESLDRSGQTEAAAALRAAAGGLDEWRRDVVRRTGDALAVHHDIRNALTGILGNAQLLQMGQAVALPGVRKRLDSVVREAERIRDLTERLHHARAELLDAGDETVVRKEPEADADPRSGEAA
jgi:signal transduction histidine kinase